MWIENGHGVVVAVVVVVNSCRVGEMHRNQRKFRSIQWKLQCGFWQRQSNAWWCVECLGTRNVPLENANVAPTLSFFFFLNKKSIGCFTPCVSMSPHWRASWQALLGVGCRREVCKRISSCRHGASTMQLRIPTQSFEPQTMHT